MRVPSRTPAGGCFSRLAVIDRNTCIPWAEGRECLVCEELCPIPQKAIVFETVDGGGDADSPGVKLPVVIDTPCTGCGICEHNCPVSVVAVIRVRAITPMGTLSR